MCGESAKARLVSEVRDRQSLRSWRGGYIQIQTVYCSREPPLSVQISAALPPASSAALSDASSDNMSDA